MPTARLSASVSDDAAELRRRVGPTAWCVLEILAASPERGRDGGTTVEASIRGVAAVLGVSKNAVQRAFVRLQRAGLVVPAQRRARDGRFDVGRYIVSPLADLDAIRTIASVDAEPSRSTPCAVSPTAHCASTRERSLEPRVVEQLVLLPPD